MRSYGPITAVLYDVFSGERPLYRRGRLAAVEGLRLRPGDRVLVLGSGTGLDLPFVADAIGSGGTIVAVDRSRWMLRRTGRRLRRGSGPDVRLVLADLTRARTLLPPGTEAVDAVLAVNTLSLVPDWRAAWSTGLRAARAGARVAVADIGRPTGSPALDLWSRVVSFVGGGDLDARPWSAVEEQASSVRATTFWRGHVEVRAGVLDGWRAPDSA